MRDVAHVSPRTLVSPFEPVRSCKVRRRALLVIHRIVAIVGANDRPAVVRRRDTERSCPHLLSRLCSKRSQERDKGGFVGSCERKRESRVVELDNLVEARRKAIVKVRRSRRECSQDWPLETADVLPFAG